jgi:hypothetical protein
MGEYSPFSTVSSSASIKARGDGDVDRMLDEIEISDVVLKFLPDDPQTNFSTRMVRTLRLRFPKPRNCLGLIDLQTATEVITLFTVINKVSGFYGILSLFTGNSHCPCHTNLRRSNVVAADEHVYLVNHRHWSMFMGSQTNERSIFIVVIFVDCRKNQ